MIDKLIEADFAALAAEDRQAIPPEAPWFEVVQPAQKRRRSWRPVIMPALPFVIGSVAAVALYEESFTVSHLAPQLAIALGLVMMAMFGLAGRSPSSSPLASILAAGLFTLVAVVGFSVEWHHHRTDCLFVDGYSIVTAPCQDSRVVATTWFALSAWGVAIVVALCASRMVRRRGPEKWGVAAKLITAAVLLTWTGLNQYIDRSIDLVRFHATPYLQAGALLGTDYRVRIYDPHLAGMIRRVSDDGQWNALESGLVALVLAISIGIACTREGKRPSRWLRLLESPFVMPLGVIIATVSLVLATAQFELFKLHRGDADDIPWFAAWASIGAVVAYASMLLRRRRREALS